MYNYIISAALLAGPLVPIPPDPPPVTMEIILSDFINSAPDMFTVPSGTLPWSVPAMPAIDIDLDIDEPVFDEVEHSLEYQDNIDDMTANFGIVQDPEIAAETGIEEWIGSGGILPDATGAGDFDIEIDTPDYEDITAYEVAAELGDNLGTLFSWIRALTELSDLHASLAVFGFIILCICWMLLVTFFKFASQFIDMLFSVIVRIIELIPVAE